MPRFEVSFKLDGGVLGSGASDLAESISITNTSESTPLDFHFFQYTNFDLEGTAGGDSVVFVNANAVQQFEESSRLTESVITPAASHREAAFLSTTIDKLNDGVATTLSDTPLNTVVGPGDVTWAFQWDFTIQPNTTVQISKDKNLQAVPEPSSWLLLAIGSALLLAFRVREQRGVRTIFK